MIKKTIEYINYNGDVVKSDYYFNISRAELIDLEFSTPGGYGDYLQRIIDAQDAIALYKAVTQIIDLAYGEKSADGKRFIKSQEILDSFKQSEAYSELIMGFLTDTNSLISFVNGILPDVSKYVENDAKQELGNKVAAKLNIVSND